MNEKWKIIFIVTAGIMMIVPFCMAGNPVDWSFTIETTGQSASWVSTTHINPAFGAYDCKYVLTDVQIDVNGTWMDYFADSNLTGIDANGGGSSYDGLPVSAYDWYDTNEVQASLSVWADAEGLGHVAISNITFGQYRDLPVTGMKVSGTIRVLGLKPIWVDSFDSYGTATDLNKTTAWNAPWTTYTTGGTTPDYMVRGIWAGSNYGNRASYMCNYWGDERRIARIKDTSILGAFDPNHVRFKVDAWDTQVNQETVWNSWWLVGRYTSASKLVAVCAEYGTFDAGYYNDDGIRTLYTKLIDLGGTGDAYDSGDYFITYADPTKPITLELDFDVNNVTARVSHNGASVTLSFVTTVTGGKPGMGGYNPWAYAYGEYDDFGIYDNTPYNPTDCDDTLAYHFDADINKDCKVDFVDFAEFALDWLECTDPTNAECL